MNTNILLILIIIVGIISSGCISQKGRPHTVRAALSLPPGMEIGDQVLFVGPIYRRQQTRLKVILFFRPRLIPRVPSCSFTNARMRNSSSRVIVPSARALPIEWSAYSALSLWNCWSSLVGARPVLLRRMAFASLTLPLNLVTGIPTFRTEASAVI
jgi:hypothetical protein